MERCGDGLGERTNERFPRVFRDVLSSEELVESSNSTKKLERLCSQFNRIPLRSQGFRPLLPIYIVIHTRARWCTYARCDNPEKGSDSSPFVIRSVTLLVAKRINLDKKLSPKFLKGQPFGKYLVCVLLKQSI